MRLGGGRRVLRVAAVAIPFAIAACTSSGGNPARETLPATSTTHVERVDDDVLQIGVLLPSSGEGASIGESARAAVRVAVSLANEAGGVNGAIVKLITRDEGADAASAAVALQQLIDNQVDVIVGPASSNVESALLPVIVQAGIASCSPSASALGLDGFPDNGLFFRTIPSDSLEAEAIASVIEQTGETSAAIAYVDDGYGGPLEAALEVALRNRRITVLDSVGFAVDDDEFSSEADRLINAGDGALALIGDPDAGERMLAAIAESLGDQPRDIVLNDALRRPWPVGLLQSVPQATRVRIVGVSPSVKTSSDELLALIRNRDPAASGFFATQAYDCANLFMLAADQARSTLPAAIAEVVPEMSVGGSICQSYAACAPLVAEGRNIDYDSPGGTLSLGPVGDPSSANYEVYFFDETGRDVSLRTVFAALSG